MKNNLKKSISGILCLLLLSSTVACEQEEVVPTLPAYTLKTAQNATFAYNGPTDGVYYFDTEKREYGTQRTVEGYQTYKEAGFDTVYLTDTASFDSRETAWVAGTETYDCFKNATQAGIEKIILEDAVFEDMIVKKGSALEGADDNGDGVSDELFTAVYDELKLYCYENGFYGVKLGDRPNHEMIESYGHMYRAIRLASKKLYEEGVTGGKTDGLMKNDGYVAIHVNMAEVDYTGLSSFYAQPYEDITGEKYYESYKETYSRYLTNMIESCGGGYDATTKLGMDKISVGLQPFRSTTLANGLYPMLQTFAEICKEEGVQLNYVCQSMKSYTNDALMFDGVSESEMALELYSALGFGATSVSYYTYMPTANWSTTGNKMLDDGCFIGRDGTKNSTYYYGQQLLAEWNAMQPILSNYEYQGARIYAADSATIKVDATPYLQTGVDENCDVDGQTLGFDNTYQFAALKNFTFTNDMALVTELKDGGNDLHMYMIQNILDPRVTKNFETTGIAKVDFGTEYKYVAVLESGNISYEKLNNGVYEKALSAGYAVFLIPLK